MAVTHSPTIEEKGREAEDNVNVRLLRGKSVGI